MNSPRGGFAGRARGNLRGRGNGPYSGRGTPRGSSTPRGNAPPRPEYASPMRGNAPSAPTRGGMGARNRRGGKMGSYNAPLSSLLYEERPLLRPIVFVRSTLTATLFQEEEEIFEPGVEEIDDAEKSHVPTANRVNQVFHIKDEDEEDDRHGATHGADDNVDGDEEEELEEIDFADIGKFQEQVDAGAIAMSSVKEVEERFTGIHIGGRGREREVMDTTTTAMNMEADVNSYVEASTDMVVEAEPAAQEAKEEEMVVDADPSEQASREEKRAKERAQEQENQDNDNESRADEQEKRTEAQETQVEQVPQAEEYAQVEAEVVEATTAVEVVTAPAYESSLPTDAAPASSTALEAAREEIREVARGEPLEVAHEEAHAVAQEEVLEVAREEAREAAREEHAFVANTTSTLAEEAPAPAVAEQAAMETTATSAEEHPVFFVDTAPAPVDTSSTPSTEAPAHTAEGHEATADVPAPTEEQASFFIDTTPSMIDVPTTVPSRIAQLTRELQDEDEVIVYVAPHPRSTRATPAPAPPQMTSMLTGTTKTVDATTLSKAWASTPAPLAAAVSPPAPEPFASVPQPSTPKAGPSFSFTRSGTRQPRHAPAVTPDGRARTRIRERQKNKKRRPKGEWGALGFGAFGAMHEEELWAPDPRYAERRRGDSDLEWGTDDEDEGDAGATGVAEGMEVDADLVADDGAMRRFVQSMGVEGQRHVTMDDVRDGEILKAEDEEEDERGPESESSDDDEDEEEDLAADLDAILHQEEVEMMGESDDDDEDSDDSDDVDDTPQTSFRKRLERMRAAKGKQRASAPKVANDSDDDMEMDIGWEVDDYDAMEWSNADADEAFLDHVDKLLAENKHLLKGKGKKRHDKLFNNILNGSFDMEDSLDELAQFNEFTSSKRKKEKYESLPVELQEQWEKDRAKKAANKRARQLARMQVAADPLAPKKGGKKMKKAIAAAARQMDPSYGRGDMAYSDDEDLPGTIHVIPNRVIDINTLVMEIRRFIADIGRVSMALPPANKETRKKVHDLAEAFGLKSKSKGKGDARYTTLTRTSRTGYAVSERKIGKIVRGAGGHGGMFGSSSYGGEKGKKGKGGGAPVRVPRHREGEEVGGTAPKIGESNVGFKMLAMMGWQDGQRIGVSGGLDAPIAAIMKTTKLGLGATN
ncbi:hypothetical protein K523DRAFT_271177 [Schizophyllum commune Tattone D]|nr:hypothetical protein K523DRAFT_271177 [Schizophyllum commune Tattone D]